MENLIGHIRQNAGSKWQDDWLQKIVVIPSLLIPNVLLEGVESAKNRISDVQEIYEILNKIISSTKDDEKEKQIELRKLALELINDKTNPYLRAFLLSDIASIYLKDEEQITKDDFEQAIFYLHKALEIFTPEIYPKEWAQAINNLASSYRNRIIGNKVENIELAIHYYLEIIEVFPAGLDPKLWLLIKYGLASAYYDPKAVYPSENLKKMKNLYQEVLSTPDFREMYPKKWANAHARIAFELTIISNTSDPLAASDNYEKAICHCLQAMEVWNKETQPEEWSWTYLLLGGAFSKRTQGNRADNLEKSITSFRKALEVSTPESYQSNWIWVKNYLGLSYINRIYGDKAQNIEQAIIIFNDVLGKISYEQDPTESAWTIRNLGLAYFFRVLGNKTENIEQAIHYYMKSLQIITKDDSPNEWAQTYNQLGFAYGSLSLGNPQENIKLAISYFCKTLEVYKPDTFSIEWAQVQNNLGIAYREYTLGNVADNIDFAIDHFILALEFYSRNGLISPQTETELNLAIAYHNRIYGVQEDNLKEAITYLQHILEVTNPKVNSYLCRAAASILGLIYQQTNEWEKATRSYEIAINADQYLYHISFLRQTKEAYIAEMTGFFTNAAYAALMNKENLKALEIIEMGRARQISEALDLNRTNLEHLNEIGLNDLYNEFTSTSIKLLEIQQPEQSGLKIGPINNLITSSIDLVSIETIQNNLLEIIEKIREIPGFQSFLKPLSAKEIIEIAYDVPIVYICGHDQGGFEIIVKPDGQVDSLKFDELTDISIYQRIWGTGEALGNGYFKDYLDWKNIIDYDSIPNNQNEIITRHWFDKIQEITSWLWNACVEKTVDYLKARGFKETVIIPIGSLGYLPLHAAWQEDISKPDGKRYALDEICFRYAPNARSLLPSIQRQDKSSNTLIAIDDPNKDNPILHLINSQEEVSVIMSYFPQRNPRRLIALAATVNAVLQEMPNYNVIHFATHGLANPNNPLESYLLLAEQEHLTIQDILSTHLDKTRLVILSACETAIQGIPHLDEAVSLPSGFIQAGALGVIGTLWSVSDRSTMKLMTQFYELWKGRNIDPSEALRQAQIWLRSFSTYSHPYYWAAFTYTGT